MRNKKIIFFARKLTIFYQSKITFQDMFYPTHQKKKPDKIEQADFENKTEQKKKYYLANLGDIYFRRNFFHFC